MVKPSTARVTDRYRSAFQSGPESGALFSFGQISSGNLDSRSVWGATGLETARSPRGHNARRTYTQLDRLLASRFCACTPGSADNM